MIKMNRITRIIFASQNAGKVAEVTLLLKDMGITVISASEAGVTESAVENGKYFVDNARKKAVFVGNRTREREWTMGDDSGICVVALIGEPGVQSTRWAGENAPGEEWVRLMLAKLQGIPEGQRQAWFETAVVLRSPNGVLWHFSGRIDGRIALEPRGIPHPGVPYDSVFIPNGQNKTFAEMAIEEKNAISHRGQAFRQLKEFIKENLK